MADSSKVYCALHAVQMAFELMDELRAEADMLEMLSKKFLDRMVCSE